MSQRPIIISYFLLDSTLLTTVHIPGLRELTTKLHDYLHLVSWNLTDLLALYRVKFRVEIWVVSSYPQCVFLFFSWLAGLERGKQFPPPPLPLPLVFFFFLPLFFFLQQVPFLLVSMCVLTSSSVLKWLGRRILSPHSLHYCMYICLILFNLGGEDSSVPPVQCNVVKILQSWFLLNWPTLWDRVRT